MKNRTLCREDQPLRAVGVADNYFTRLRGLIGRDAKALGGLWIRPCGQIHTCFMSEAIDVLYLDRDGRVLRIDTAVPKNRFFRAVKQARQVLELPASDAAILKLQPGDTLSLRAL